MNAFSKFSRIGITAVLAIVAVIATVAAKMPKTLYTVTLSRQFYKANIKFMHDNDFDVAGVSMKKDEVYLIVDKDQKAKLSSLGPMALKEESKVSTAAPDSKFKNPEQVAEILKALTAQYPTLAQVSSIGKSLEGRDILVLKITKNVSQDSSAKPAVLYNAMHHAREVMSTEVTLDIADYLLKNYGKDDKVTHWVDANVIYVVPMFNVDGNNKVWTQDNMWRKNARGTYGVDINRNYPYLWNTCNGSSGSESAQDYRGPSAGSEPETHVLMDFVMATHPVFSISYHSYSELVIYPYGCGSHTETSQIVDPIGKTLADLTIGDDGSSKYTAGVAPDLLYSVDGSDIDYFYHEAKVLPYVMEVNSQEQGFQPDYNQWRDSTVTRLRPAWQYLLERLDGPGVSGRVANYDKSAGVAQIHIFSTISDAPTASAVSKYDETYPLHDDGSFHVILTPGDYRLNVVNAAGKSLGMKDVHVDNAVVKVEI